MTTIYPEVRNVVWHENGRPGFQGLEITFEVSRPDIGELDWGDAEERSGIKLGYYGPGSLEPSIPISQIEALLAMYRIETLQVFCPNKTTTEILFVLQKDEDDLDFTLTVVSQNEFLQWPPGGSTNGTLTQPYGLVTKSIWYPDSCVRLEGDDPDDMIEIQIDNTSSCCETWGMNGEEKLKELLADHQPIMAVYLNVKREKEEQQKAADSDYHCLAIDIMALDGFIAPITAWTQHNGYYPHYVTWKWRGNVSGSECI